MEHPDLPFRGSPPDRKLVLLEQGFPFSPKAWSSAIDPIAWPMALDQCPRDDKGRPVLDRRAVFSIAEQPSSPQMAAQTLVACLIWGTGLGGWNRIRRLHVMKAGGKAVGDTLDRVAHTLRQEGPDAAFIALHTPRGNAVKWLGPSFGTKFLYFVGYNQSPSERRPLILDQYVALALNRLCGWDLPTGKGGWSASQYGTYLDTAHRWAIDWGTEPDVIERVLFSVGRSSSLTVSALSGR